MSMQHWTEEGFGFPLNTVDNDEAIFTFINAYGKEHYSWEEFREVKEDAEYGDALWEFFGEPVSYIVADIINDLEGLTVVKGYAPCGDTDQEEMIGIEPCFPWTINEKDRQLTREKAEAILEKYAGMLLIDEHPDYFEAQYFG